MSYTRDFPLLVHFQTSHFMDFQSRDIFLDYDHYKLADFLDFTVWDNYPLGAMGYLPYSQQLYYCTTGHPDVSSYDHDRYRSMSPSRSFWVMEQQPGVIYWGTFNPAPAPGMVELWSWEAMSHGADVVSYFRWRQVPYAQEQYLSALLNPNNEPDEGEMCFVC